jgi:hypothetical protein
MKINNKIYLQMSNIILIFATDNKHNNTNQKHNDMKNTQLEVNQDKTRKTVFLLILLLLPVILMAFSLLRF